MKMVSPKPLFRAPGGGEGLWRATCAAKLKVHGEARAQGGPADMDVGSRPLAMDGQLGREGRCKPELSRRTLRANAGASHNLRHPPFSYYTLNRKATTSPSFKR